ncbi:Retrovirus-related Pol polyprotein from transposon RE1 [Araneus ventricosus]|uniref:Retrovirus-related Pol polyprotein from transposon RE1 n=1 Tax=Araneus ventricosus TaxID=182803 RepID=A0A4Y2A0M6_ARAVE|nr:Retrovirus-related Pol polyprotein from transposon RE1 [Araneus ventricosus]
MAFAESCNFEKLNNNNYKQWKFNIKMQLLNLGLIEFVDKQEPVLDAEATKADKQNFELRKAKALSTICLSIDENLKSIVYNIDSPVAALQEIENVFEPRSRARIRALRTKFLNILFLPSDTISSYIGKISQAAKDLENAGKVIPDDEIAYQMLANLPRSYDNIVMQLYQLDDKNFTSLNVQKSLLAEYDRVIVCEKSEARPKEPAVFSIESDKLSSSASMAEGTTNILGKGDVRLEIMDNSERYNDGRMRSKNEVKKYCESKGIDYNPDNFDFSPKLILDDNEPNAIETQSDDFSTDIEDISDSEAHLVDIKIPNNFKESQMVPERENWCNAKKEELEILKARDVYEIVPRPQNKNVLGNKWVYTLKKDVPGKIKRYRARLVAQGFKQIEGIDYFDTFSPVINFTLVRFIVILVTMKGWLCNHLDIKSAYLYAPLNIFMEDIFMEQPSGFVIDNENNSVFKLKKALCGLKQAGREWYSELNNSLIELGFQKHLTSNCIYVYKSFVLLLVYVDDIAIFVCNEKYMNEANCLIKSKFDVKDLGKLSKFLGIEFEMRNGNFIMHQKSYINKRRNIFGNIPNCKILVPLSPGIAIYDNKEHDVLNVPYRNLIGSLSFLESRTRPDIMFAVNFLSQFNNNPSITHWNLICHYVLNTSNYEINLSRSESFALTAYTDASWAADKIDRKSISGYVIFLGDVPVSWSTSKQKCTALLSTSSTRTAMPVESGLQQNKKKSPTMTRKSCQNKRYTL